MAFNKWRTKSDSLEFQVYRSTDGKVWTGEAIFFSCEVYIFCLADDDPLPAIY